jgi:hypothetical protein
MSNTDLTKIYVGDEDGVGECVDCNFMSDTLNDDMVCKECLPKTKKLSLWIAMNKDEFDVNNMSYLKTKAEAYRRWGDRQIIRKATLIIEL